MKTKQRKERLAKALTELKFSKFKVQLRTGTMTRTVRRIENTIRDIKRFGNGHIYRRDLDFDVNLLRDTTTALNAMTAEISAIVSIAILDSTENESD